MPNFSTALCSSFTECSSDSSGECTPITTSPAADLFCTIESTQGRELTQLTHSKAHISTSTTLPLRPASVSGSELIQSLACWCVNSGGVVGAAPLSTAQVTSSNAMRLIPFIYHPCWAAFPT